MKCFVKGHFQIYDFHVSPLLHTFVTDINRNNRRTVKRNVDLLRGHPYQNQLFSSAFPLHSQIPFNGKRKSGFLKVYVYILGNNTCS